MDPALLGLLGAVGLTLIVTLGSIFAPLRGRLKTRLVRCSQCLGAWVGFAVGLWLWWPVSLAVVVPVILFGGAVSGGGYTLHLVWRVLDERLYALRVENDAIEAKRAAPPGEHREV